VFPDFTKVVCTANCQCIVIRVNGILNGECLLVKLETHALNADAVSMASQYWHASSMQFDSLVQTKNHGRELLTNAGGGVEAAYGPEVMLPEAGNLELGDRYYQ